MSQVETRPLRLLVVANAAIEQHRMMRLSDEYRWQIRSRMWVPPLHFSATIPAGCLSLWLLNHHRVAGSTVLTIENLVSGRFASARDAPFPNVNSSGFVVSNLSQLGILPRTGCGRGGYWCSIGDGGFHPNSVAIVVENLVGEILDTQVVHKGVVTIDDPKVERVVGVGCVTRLISKG